MKDKISILLFDFFRLLLKYFPASFGRYLGKFIAFLAYLLTPKRRKRAASNIKKALNVDQKQAQKILKGSYLNLGYLFTEFLQQDRFSREEIEQMLSYSGLEDLKKAAAENNGVILYTAHLGNWELMGAVLSKNNFQVDAIAREQNNSIFDQKINEIRNNAGVGIIPKGLAVRKVFKSLKQKRLVAILGDQDARSNGWKLNFFNRDASTFAGAVQFAKRTGAPIVPIFMHRKGYLKHELVCYPPRKISADASQEDLKKELQSLLNLTEKEIKKAPADWMWLHKRWKTYS